MSFISELDYILNDYFIETGNKIIENELKLNIKNDGINYLLFKPDKKLIDFKGGFFPFFKNNKNVQKLCDYLLFAELYGNKYVLIIEIKKSKNETLKQLIAGKSFAKFINETINRIHNKNYNFNLRYISIIECNLKAKTKFKDIDYDKNNHFDFNLNSFPLKFLLK